MRWHKVICILGLLLFVAMTGLAIPPAYTEYRIGILADRGKEDCLKAWTPTAEYLEHHIITKCRFRIVPLLYSEIEDAVKRRQIDFLLVQPSLAVVIDLKYGAVWVATAERQRWHNKSYNVYGAVVFCRNDNKDINTLADLKNHSFMAASKDAFCGWLTTKELLLRNKINPEKDFKSFEFAGTQDGVVRAVKAGKVDVGTIRTNLLEDMVTEGEVRMDDFKIINSMNYPVDRFPFVCSTPLYPECPLIDVRENRGGELDKQIAMALLMMSINDRAAVMARIGGWSTPLNYAPVEDCLKMVGYGPFKDYGKITIRDIIHKYWPALLSLLLTVMVVAAFAAYAVRANRRLHGVMAERVRELEERKRAEEEMRQIFDIAGDGMVVFDPQMHVTTANEQFLRMSGWTREQLLGKNCQELHLCNAANCNAEHCVIQRVVDRRQRIEYEGKLSLAGNMVSCACSLVPYNNIDGSLRGVIQNIKDISDRIKAEDAAASEAEQRGRSMMASTVLHDIGNAVTGLGTMTAKMASEREWQETQSLQMLVNMVQTRQEDFAKALGPEQAKGLGDFLVKLYEAFEVKRKGLEDIFRRVTLSVVHIKDVLSLQRMYADNGRLSMTKATLSEVITDAVAMQYASLQKRNIAVHYDFAAGISHVKIDKTRMIQVFINLLKNACESFDELNDDRQRQVTIAIRENNGNVLLNFTDNGMGCSPETLANLFKNGFTTKRMGTGIGLYQCRSIIESHGGTIALSSEGNGKGMKIEIVLPVMI